MIIIINYYEHTPDKKILLLLLVQPVNSLVWLSTHIDLFHIVAKLSMHPSTLLPLSRSKSVEHFPMTDILSPNPFFATIFLATLAIGPNA